MEAFSSYVLSLVLVPLSLYLLSFIRKNASKNRPPGSTGWPLLGENIVFALLGPEKFIKKRMEKYSDEVFQSSLFGHNIAIFCGAQGNRFLFTNENKLVTAWWPRTILKLLGFPELMDREAMEVGKPLRAFRHDIFKPEALKIYIPVMDALAREHVNSYWSTPNKVVKVYDMARKYTFELGCRLFLNVVDPDQLNKLSEHFHAIKSAIFSVPIDLPGTTYNRGVKGSKKVREELMRIIKERRKELSAMKSNEEIIANDVLSKMLLEDNGEFSSDMEICCSIIGLLIGSNETTSVTTTAVMNNLAQFPHIYEEVYKEQMEIAKSKGPNELLTWEDVEKMKYSWNVARETLRLLPPAPGSFRVTTTEFTYAGFTIPKGWKTFWTVHSSHKNPKYFPDPEKFDPSRFEGSGPVPYAFVPFGGGVRMCPGKEYARLQILIYMYNVVTRFRFEKAIPNEKIVVRTLPAPAYGLPLHIYPHGK